MDPSLDGAPPTSSHGKEEAGARATDAGARPEKTGRRGLSGATAAFSQGILESITDGVVVADREGRFRHFNRAAERILGIGLMEVPPSEWPKTYGCFLEDRVTPYPPDELPLVRADRERLRQVITNLVDNAVKYSPPGAEVDVLAFVENGRVTVEVRDRGPGVAPEPRH